MSLRHNTDTKNELPVTAARSWEALLEVNKSSQVAILSMVLPILLASLRKTAIPRRGAQSISFHTIPTDCDQGACVGPGSVWRRRQKKPHILSLSLWRFLGKILCWPAKE
ncbi:hypothetical protein JTE90_001310 [Oedothorax gibbosus]|uniref:Uncharacterized protein n=1 Tax=Oedothorax gibbosus TaxID=931172 RepID=A0AAV6TQZ2_9ARAC|nr:hypothetical protein JTE90_001310 [Oedothorax gibbosus]